jgi:hypothetical protein
MKIRVLHQSQVIFAWRDPWSWLLAVYARGDLGHGYRDFLLELDGRLEQIFSNMPGGGGSWLDPS